MIKKIPIGQLKMGMFIHDLQGDWSGHPFPRDRFLINRMDILDKLHAASINEVTIDTENGADIGQAGLKKDTPQNFSSMASDDSMDDLSSLLVTEDEAPILPAEAFQRAKILYSSAKKLMQDILNDARQQKKIELRQCDVVINDVVDSMSRFPSVLLPMLQMKTRTEYSLQHSVAVAALAVAFGQRLALPHKEVRDVALGGFLQDIGKALIPGRIVNKVGKLDAEEFEIMQSHVGHSLKLLRDMQGISEITLLAVAQHHERYDGTGYPNRLRGEAISVYGQMLAILDTYDAITSISTFRKGSTPTATLKKLFEWSGKHFDPKLVQIFIKGIGIYPAGSLVRLASGRLGIVREVASDKLLQPVVQLIYDCKKLDYIAPLTVDLAASKDKIVSHESFAQWGMDPARWAVAHL